MFALATRDRENGNAFFSKGKTEEEQEGSDSQQSSYLFVRGKRGREGERETVKARKEKRDAILFHFCSLHKRNPSPRLAPSSSAHMRADRHTHTGSQGDAITRACSRRDAR